MQLSSKKNVEKVSPEKKTVELSNNYYFVINDRDAEEYHPKVLKSPNFSLEMLYVFFDIACSNAQNCTSHKYVAENYFLHNKEYNNPDFYAAFTNCITRLKPRIVAPDDADEEIQCPFCDKRMRSQLFLEFTHRKNQYLINVPMFLHTLIKHNSNTDYTLVALIAGLLMDNLPTVKTLNEMKKEELIEIINTGTDKMKLLEARLLTLTTQVETLMKMNDVCTPVCEPPVALTIGETLILPDINTEETAKEIEELDTPETEDEDIFIRCPNCEDETTEETEVEETNSDADSSTFECSNCGCEFKVMDEDDSIVIIEEGEEQDSELEPDTDEEEETLPESSEEIEEEEDDEPEPPAVKHEKKPVVIVKKKTAHKK